MKERVGNIVWMWFSIISFLVVWAIWGAMAWLVGWLISGQINPWMWFQIGQVAFLVLGAIVGVLIAYALIQRFYFEEIMNPKK